MTLPNSPAWKSSIHFARGDPLAQIPKFGIVLVVVLVLGALGFRDRKETDVLQLICSVSLIAKRSGFSRTTTTTSTRTNPQIRNLGLALVKRSAMNGEPRTSNASWP